MNVFLNAHQAPPAATIAIAARVSWGVPEVAGLGLATLLCSFPVGIGAGRVSPSLRLRRGSKDRPLGGAVVVSPSLGGVVSVRRLTLFTPSFILDVALRKKLLQPTLLVRFIFKLLGSSHTPGLTAKSSLTRLFSIASWYLCTESERSSSITAFSNSCVSSCLSSCAMPPPPTIELRMLTCAPRTQ